MLYLPALPPTNGEDFVISIEGTRALVGCSFLMDSSPEAEAAAFPESAIKSEKWVTTS